MDQPKLTKERVREYMERRQLERRRDAQAPLHNQDQIRKEIGWDLSERRVNGRRSAKK